MDVLAVLSQEPLDPNSEVPLYRQLKDRIIQVIATRALDEKTPLPTEVDISHALGLSRGTVRRCFEDLVKEGRVVRRRGHGTYVNLAPKRTAHDSTFNFTREIQAMGKRPSSKVVGLRKIYGNEALARPLGLESHEEVWEIRRVRYANDEPLQYVCAYVPCKFVPSLSRKGLEQSLYALIAQASGALPARAVELYEAISLDAKEASMLQVPCGAAALRIMRTTFDQHGEPFEASIIVCRGDLHRFLLTVENDHSVFQKVTG